MGKGKDKQTKKGIESSKNELKAFILNIFTQNDDEHMAFVIAKDKDSAKQYALNKLELKEEDILSIRIQELEIKEGNAYVITLWENIDEGEDYDMEY